MESVMCLIVVLQCFRDLCWCFVQVTATVTMVRARKCRRSRQTHMVVLSRGTFQHVPKQAHALCVAQLHSVLLVFIHHTPHWCDATIQGPETTTHHTTTISLPTAPVSTTFKAMGHRNKQMPCAYICVWMMRKWYRCVNSARTLCVHAYKQP